jgi:hypothetical protein
MDTDLKHSLEEERSVVFQPDTLISDKYFAHFRTSQLDPEKKLMAAVLEDAVLCFQKHLRAKDKKGKSLFLDAEEWILTNDPDWLFSFDNVCETLGLHPDYLRQGLLRWKETKLGENGGNNGTPTPSTTKKRRSLHSHARLPKAA